MDLFHISMSSGIRRYLHVLSFCLLEGFKVSAWFVLLYLGVFIKGVLWIFWFTFSRVQVSEFVCPGFVVRGFQTVILFVKDELWSWVFCLSEGSWFNCWFHLVQSVWGFSIKRFLLVLFFVFVGLHVVSEVFFFSGSLCLLAFWVSAGCFRSFGLVFQRFRGLNVRGFFQVWSFSLRFGYQMNPRFSWQRFFSGQVFQIFRGLDVSDLRSSLCQRVKLDSLWLISVLFHRLVGKCSWVCNVT